MNLLENSGSHGISGFMDVNLRESSAGGSALHYKNYQEAVLKIQ